MPVANLENFWLLVQSSEWKLYNFGQISANNVHDRSLNWPCSRFEFQWRLQFWWLTVHMCRPESSHILYGIISRFESSNFFHATVFWTPSSKTRDRQINFELETLRQVLVSIRLFRANSDVVYSKRVTFPIIVSSVFHDLWSQLTSRNAFRSSAPPLCFTLLIFCRRFEKKCSTIKVTFIL